MYTLNCKGKLLTIDQPLVMGIINVTPDSFYQGHAGLGVNGMVTLAGDMLKEGADILDIGGQSTRPGSGRMEAQQEAERVIPIIIALHEQYPDAILSVDTYHSRVAEKAVAAGASMVNDIGGGLMDPDMISLVATLNVPYICMHLKGTPENMQQKAVYDDVVKEVLDYFIGKIAECKQAGINDVIVDPGFGFAKTIHHNFQLLQQLSLFSILEKPLLAGLSRKATIYKTLGTTAAEALNGTTILNTLALTQGASLLRVHDVKEAVEAVRLFDAFKNGALVTGIN